MCERFEWFAIDYTGRFWASEPGTYRLALASDDGSNRYLDGKRVIENDKQHPVMEKQGPVRPKTGVHRIRVSYSQGPRTSPWSFGGQVPVRTSFAVFHADDFKPRPDSSG